MDNHRSAFPSRRKKAACSEMPNFPADKLPQFHTVGRKALGTDRAGTPSSYKHAAIEGVGKNRISPLADGEGIVAHAAIGRGSNTPGTKRTRVDSGLQRW